MILSAGLSPAWQHILVFDRFQYGEVNRAVEAVWCTSGKVANAGLAAHHLGGPSLTLAPVGGLPAAAMDRELTELGVPHRFLPTAAATRVCTTILDRADQSMTELVENGLPLTAEELDAFLEAYAAEARQASVAVLIGSLPAGTPASFYGELLRRTPCPAVLDFHGPGLLDALDLKPLFIKPNRAELARTVGRPLESDVQLLQAMRELNQRGAQWVVVSQGSGPVCMSSSTEAYRLYPPGAKQVVNPIGCGDAMAATLAWATREGHSPLAAARLAVAAAADNLRQLLPCRLDPVWIAQHAERVHVEPWLPT